MYLNKNTLKDITGIKATSLEVSHITSFTLLVGQTKCQ